MEAWDVKITKGSFRRFCRFRRHQPYQRRIRLALLCVIFRIRIGRNNPSRYQINVRSYLAHR